MARVLFVRNYADPILLNLAGNSYPLMMTLVSFKLFYPDVCLGASYIWCFLAYLLVAEEYLIIPLLSSCSLLLFIIYRGTYILMLSS